MLHKATIAPPTCHAITLFDDVGHLGEVVGAFLAEGLAAGAPGLVLANPVSQGVITADLLGRGLDVEALLAGGRLQLVDADEMLARLMPDGRINNALYHELVGPILTNLLGGGPGPVRIYGSLADTLWERGDFDAAVRLEVLSNQVALLHPVSILCGYLASHVARPDSRLEMIRKLHGRAHAAKAGLRLVSQSHALRA